MIKKIRQNITGIWLVLLAILVFILILIAFASPKDNLAKFHPARAVDNAIIRTNNEEYETSLPFGVKNLKSETEAELLFTVPGDTEMLFFSMIYTPLNVYVNDKLAYSYGHEKSVSNIFRDPPKNFATIKLNSVNNPEPAGSDEPDSQPPEKPDLSNSEPPENPADLPDNIPADSSSQVSSYEIRMVYTVPLYRDKVMINSPLFGSESNIYRHLLNQFGVPLAFASFFTLLGIILIIFAIILQRFEFTRKLLIWLGIFALLTGIWQISDNTLAIYLARRPTLCYVLTYLCMFSLVMPIYRYAIVVLDFKNNLLLKIFAKIQGWSLIAAILLQLAGIFPLHFCSSYFSLLLPVCLIVLTVYILIEFAHNRSIVSGGFAISLIVVTITETLELSSKNLRYGRKDIYFFQIGMLAFIILLSIVSVVNFEQLQQNALQVVELKYNLELQGKTIEAQKAKNEVLISHYDEVKKQRHDIRHHIRTLEELLNAGNYNEMSSYLKSMTDELPVYTDIVYCDNTVLNSTIGYYVQLAEKKNICTKIRVSIPDKNEHISDANLCVIFGNMLENAIEACEKVEEGKRFINLSSQINGSMMFITMDNSCAPDTLREQNGTYLSSKSGGYGQGLKSIASMAERHNGSVTFKSEGSVFKTNVCVQL